ncbi:MAG: TIGR04282 family arsenosugar biosynthesis glycosyltransferase [Minwuia sp.]|uniref:TIGR04282 family arsenosugar biosynthesis glycosyltransferase n=1 Tax=Minwuia sp. TaxID=2493630 RepID=UPI003A886E4D
MKRVLIVFAKAPRMGSVKTRLASGIGDAAALAFYRRSLARTVAQAREFPNVETVIWTAPDSAARGRYFPPSLCVLRQGIGDIGVRMARALDHHGDADRLLIGGDIPGVTPGTLSGAFEQLRTHDAVFGPAEDGGFWLVGLKRGYRPRRFFAGVTWSAPTTLDESVATLPSHARVAFAPTLNDIDDLEDYRRLKSL